MEPILIDNLQVWPEGLLEMGWDEAMERVKDLGPGWRLPTIDEFTEKLYPNRDKIPNLRGVNYWSSTEESTNWAQAFFFYYGRGLPSHKYITYAVRPVRDFTGEAALELLLKEF